MSMQVEGYTAVVDQAYYKKNPAHFPVVQAVHVSDCEVQLGQATYRATVPLRASVADRDTPPAAFEICSAPSNLQALRQGMIAVLKEKVLNDIVPMNEVLMQLREVYGDQAPADIEVTDVVKSLVARTGALNSPIAAHS